jgi:endonuclease YncB( thermonuclease family)
MGLAAKFSTRDSAMISTKRIIVVFLLATSFALADKPMVLEKLHEKVLCVIDGDVLTLQTEGKPLSIRLEGIDAPESGHKFWGGVA